MNFYNWLKKAFCHMFSVKSRAATCGPMPQHSHIHVTSRGELVRSKSEVIIANLLHAENVRYRYEHPLELGGVTKRPDFTIKNDATGVTYYWEHRSLLQEPAYRRHWEKTEARYGAHGILPQSEGGGPKGTLILSEDQPDGGIDSAKIAALVRGMK